MLVPPFFFLSAFSFWSHCIHDCAPAVQQRFKSHMQMFFQAVHQQAFYHADGIVPDLKTYIERRRNTSGCKPMFDLVKYSLDLELPDDIVEHPVIVTLNQGTNDLVMWSNVSTTLPPLPPPPHSTPSTNENNIKDLFSDNVEQSCIDMHNMICVFVIHDGLKGIWRTKLLGVLPIHIFLYFLHEFLNLPPILQTWPFDSRLHMSRWL